MAIARAAARLLVDEASHRRFSGRLLQLGPQRLYLRAGELRRYASGLHLDADLLALGDDELVPTERFFGALGFTSVESCDLFDPSADHRFDLNEPVPDDLRGRYDAVYDGGTMEHVFDTAQVLRNIHDLLAEDGLALHMAPTNNYVDHGYLMFSPSFFTGYYGANGYDVEAVWVLQHSRRWQRRRWTAFPYEPGALRHHAMGGFEQGMLLTYVAARKRAGATTGARPQEAFDAPAPGSPRSPGTLARRAATSLQARLDLVLPTDVVRIRPRRSPGRSRRL